MGLRRDLEEVEIAVTRNGPHGPATLWQVRHPADDKASAITLTTPDRRLADAVAALGIGWWNGKGYVTELVLHDAHSLRTVSAGYRDHDVSEMTAALLVEAER